LDIVVMFIKYSLFAFASLMQMALLGRAILSWFDPMSEWGVSSFLYSVTEPCIRPVRLLCNRLGWFEGTMLDIPFLITVLLLALLEAITGVGL
jgi:YggT family protein